MNNYYFTFGTNPQFPFGINEYVQVSAPTMKEAEEAYMRVYPSANEGYINCAFVYTEDDFSKIRDVYYKGVEPSDTLTAEGLVLSARDKMIVDYELSGARSVYEFLNGLDSEQTKEFKEAIGYPSDEIVEDFEEELYAER